MAVSSERKKYAIRALTRKPRRLNPLLSNGYRVIQGDTQSQGYITFDDSLVELVGKVMARGLAEFDPAFLEVREEGNGRWSISARYFVDDTIALLWVSDARPGWSANAK